LASIKGRNIIRAYATSAAYMYTVDIIATDNLGTTCNQSVVVINPFTTLSKEKESHDIISISPNPTNSTIQISNTQNISNISIKNILGSEIYNQKLNNQSSKIIDLSAQPSGVYFVTLQNSNEVFTTKIIKE
jgi:hypothetical protein